MKKKSIIALFIGLLGMGSVATSCEDMLTPEMDRYTENFDGKDTVNFYLGIMANLQEMVEQNTILGEIRGDLTTTTQYTSDSIAGIANFTDLRDGDNDLLNRAAYYKVINQCNFYLNKVDSLAAKNGVYYMQKETAQVLLIRAWTYMQLVQNYGSVPFITDPVDNANTGWETNPPKGFADANNLVDLLKNDLKQAQTYEERYGYPNYGSFNTGAVTVGHRYMMIFPADLVIADLYLLRGASQSDYELAAQHYYNYLEESDVAKIDDRQIPVSERISGGETSYTFTPTYWLSGVFTDMNYNPSVRTFVAIPSAANTSFGKVLTRIPQMYGYDIHSTNSTTTSDEDSEGNTTVTTDGQITVTPNIRTRQIAPSRSYEKLNAAQLYKRVTTNSDGIPTEIEYFEEAGDGRISGSAPYYRTDEGRVRFIQKFCATSNVYSDEASGGFSFRYVIPVYRTEQVYLRFAEAINRAGFPHYAYAILRDGLNNELIPELEDSVAVTTDEATGKKTYQTVAYFDSIDNGINYLTIDEMRRAADKPWLDFSSTVWTNTGIHAMGCGQSYDIDSLYTYDKVVAARVEEEIARSGASFEATASSLFSSVKQDAEEGTPGEGEEGGEEETGDPNIPGETEENPLPMADPVGANPAEINAVETLIADEMALETAFEGFRYYDLMRIARHKNNDVNSPVSNYGSYWMAWLISRRTLDLAPYEEPAMTDGTLFNLLSSPDNWYLPEPTY